MLQISKKIFSVKSRFSEDSKVLYEQTVFVLVFVASIFINKYVLSVLNFTYPTIFQGWQTLVGVVVLKIFVWCSSGREAWTVTPLDRKGFLALLPHFICYVLSLVAGSKALSKLPVAVFVSVSGLPVSCIFLLDQLQESVRPAGRAQLCSAALTFTSSVLVLLLDRQFEEEIDFDTSNSPYYWALIYVVCVTAQQLYTRVIPELSYTSLDKLYYGNLFSVVLLAPASIYLEEAFQALHFEYAKQTLFHVSCLISGLLATAVGLLLCRQSANQVQDQSKGRALAGIISFLVPVFRIPEGSLVKWLIVVNLSLGLLIPFDVSEGKKDQWSHKILKL